MAWEEEGRNSTGFRANGRQILSFILSGVLLIVGITLLTMAIFSGVPATLLVMGSAPITMAVMGMISVLCGAVLFGDTKAQLEQGKEKSQQSQSSPQEKALPPQQVQDINSDIPEQKKYVEQVQPGNGNPTAPGQGR